MTKAKVLIDEMAKMGSSDYLTFIRNVKKVKLKRDGKWYLVRGVIADRGINLVGHDPVKPDEIADTSRV